MNAPVAPRLFTDEPLLAVRAYLEEAVRGAAAGAEVTLRALDPDHGAGLYSGAFIERSGVRYRRRGYRAWADLADVLDLRLLTPRGFDADTVVLRFQVLDQSADLHDYRSDVDPSEKYGVDGPFYTLQKLEEPAFLNDYLSALAEVPLRRGDHIVDLGAHRGDAFLPFAQQFPEWEPELRFTGLDYCASAVADAQARFAGDNYRFQCTDLSQPQALDGLRCNLLIAIGTLQSTTLDGKDLFNRLLKNCLEDRAGVILGWPNGRYLDGEVKYGARVKNFRKPELSLLIRDLAFYRKILQKKGFRVTVRGRYYIFLTASRG